MSGQGRHEDCEGSSTLSERTHRHPSFYASFYLMIPITQPSRGRVTQRRRGRPYSLDHAFQRQPPVLLWLPSDVLTLLPYRSRHCSPGRCSESLPQCPARPRIAHYIRGQVYLTFSSLRLDAYPISISIQHYSQSH